MDRSARRPLVSYALSFAAIAGLCGVLYAPALHGPFVLDDWDNVVHNPYVRWSELSLRELSGALLGPRVWRPVAHVSFGLDHWRAGYDPAAFRSTNLLIHALCGLLVTALARALLARLRRIRPGQLARIDPAADVWLSLLAGLLFVAHPVQIQAVSYVVQRMTSLATLAYLGAILLWLRADEAGGAARSALRGAALASGALALGSKEIAIALPAALWGIHGLFVADLRRSWLRRSAPAVLVVVALALAALVWAARGPGWVLHDFGPWERLLSEPRVLWRYVSLVLLPLPSRLNLLPQVAPSRSLLDPPSTLASLLALVLAAGLALWAAPRFRFAAFGALWFGLHCALEAGPLPLRMMFEHRLYLPLVGVAVALPVVLARAIGVRRALPVLAAIVLALGLASHARNEVWGDPLRLRLDTAGKSPDDWLAQLLGAGALAEMGRGDDALSVLARASELEPASPRPHSLRGAVLRSQGRLPEALAAFERAMELDPADARARAEAARVALELGRPERAAELFEASFARSPDARVLYELAGVRERQGDLAQALALYRAAARLEPGWPDPQRAAERLAQPPSQAAEPRAAGEGAP